MAVMCERAVSKFLWDAAVFPIIWSKVSCPPKKFSWWTEFYDIATWGGFFYELFHNQSVSATLSTIQVITAKELYFGVY